MKINKWFVTIKDVTGLDVDIGEYTDYMQMIEALKYLDLFNLIYKITITKEEIEKGELK